jgi:AbrB family looped-hinge helix DNA binding protein
MESLATTRMSSKRQIVIPEAVRKKLGLEPGDQFMVLGEDDVIILKTIETPSMRDFDRLIDKARQQAKSTGMKRSDVAAAIAQVRNRQ